mmetsp:Transcript_45295/g.50416  ORF Transcript_45295/g.50416 Transcript_45295/m.50416 type:complete len:731 (+) Transcript_45295:749-2941(+)
MRQKNKVQAQVKKAVQDAIENTKVCTIPGYGACGLANLGNTCYINSALQCISYFPLLRSYLLSGEYKSTGDLNKDNPLGTKGWLLEEFVELLRFMWSSKAGEKSPTRLRQAIAKLKPDVFAGADQQDAQELLSYVLDALMEDSNRVLEKPYVEGLEDDWVRKTDLYRVGEEAWRRERRRSRSIVTDVITGQTLSTTTCPVCDYSSQKFDPFNLLSVPLPTVTDVIFKCYVVRRSNAFNTPWVLNRPKNKNGNAKVRFSPNKQINRKPPSEYLIVEQYIIAMSRLADSGDLRLKIQSVCGIPATDLIICSAEEKLTSKEKDDGTVVRRRTDLTVLTNKKGPCSQFARQRNMNEDLSTSSTSPALIVAFESTLRTRPLDGEIDESSESNHDDYDDDDDDNYDNHNRSARDRKQDESRNNKNRKSARSIKTLEESDVSTLGSSSKQRLPKKISSKELKSIMKDREESSRRLMIMEDEMDEVTAKLDKKDRITEELQRQKLENDRRIEELEAQNRKLQLEVSGSQRNLGRTIDSTNDHDRGSSSNRYASSRSNKSKASMRVVHMNGEQGDDDHDEDSSLLSGSDNDIENEKFDKSRSGAARTPSSRSMRSSSHRSKSRERLSRDTNNENENMDKRRSVTKTPSSRSMRSSDHRSKSRERLSRDENPPPSKSLSRRSSSRERVQQDVDDDRQAALRSPATRSKSRRDPAPALHTSSSLRMNNSSRGSSRRSSCQY